MAVFQTAFFFVILPRAMPMGCCNIEPFRLAELTTAKRRMLSILYNHSKKIGGHGGGGPFDEKSRSPENQRFLLILHLPQLHRNPCCLQAS